jgi:hypothetical protein
MIDFDVPLKQIGIQEIQEFLRKNGSESLYHDLKETNRYLTINKEDREKYDDHRDDLLGDINSFLNTDGGYLIFGISNNRNFTGIPLSRYQNQTTLEQVKDFVSTHIRNLIEKIHPGFSLLQIHIIPNPKVPETVIILIYVPKGPNKFYYFKNKHGVELIYQRNERDKILVSHEQIKRTYEKINGLNAPQISFPYNQKLPKMIPVISNPNNRGLEFKMFLYTYIDGLGQGLPEGVHYSGKEWIQIDKGEGFRGNFNLPISKADIISIDSAKKSLKIEIKILLKDENEIVHPTLPKGWYYDPKMQIWVYEPAQGRKRINPKYLR